MGVRYEWHDRPLVEYIEPGCDVSTGRQADEDTPYERLAETGALVISTDEAAVITGDLDEFVERVLLAVPGMEYTFSYRVVGKPGTVAYFEEEADALSFIDASVERGADRGEFKISRQQEWTFRSHWQVMP